jgi:SepF-like predicted cell division protein (DUF552 family)
MGIRDKFKTGEEDYLQLDQAPEESGPKMKTIEIEKMDSYSDSDRIQKKVRDGGIMLVKIRDLRTKDVSELKRAVERVKKTCLAIDGDIAGVGEDWIVVCGHGAKVHRDQEN